MSTVITKIVTVEASNAEDAAIAAMDAAIAEIVTVTPIPAENIDVQAVRQYRTTVTVTLPPLLDVTGREVAIDDRVAYAKQINGSDGVGANLAFGIVSAIDHETGTATIRSATTGRDNLRPASQILTIPVSLDVATFERLFECEEIVAR